MTSANPRGRRAESARATKVMTHEKSDQGIVGISDRFEEALYMDYNRQYECMIANLPNFRQYT